MLHLKTLMNPEEFQGRGVRRSYFEGWYSKVVDKSEKKAFAFIPGIAMDTEGNRQAFIQVLDGKKQVSQHHRFEINAFTAARGRFDVAISSNRFSKESITLDLPDIQGTLHFKNCIPWPTHWYSPGIMGPFAFVPFMECYHGIVSMDHRVDGQLTVQGEKIDFTDGRGYIEKDWGRSFPRAYLWMQSNHFGSPGVSVKCSVARIPWLGFSFVGFIAGVWVGNRLIQFTTYNASVLRRLTITADRVELQLENRNYHLEIHSTRNDATSLVSPIRGMMEGRVEESMTSVLQVMLTEKKTGQVILNDGGRNAGLEVAGTVSELVK